MNFYKNDDVYHVSQYIFRKGDINFAIALRKNVVLTKISPFLETYGSIIYSSNNCIMVFKDELILNFECKT